MTVRLLKCFYYHYYRIIVDHQTSPNPIIRLPVRLSGFELAIKLSSIYIPFTLRDINQFVNDRVQNLTSSRKGFVRLTRIRGQDHILASNHISTYEFSKGRKVRLG